MSDPRAADYLHDRFTTIEQQRETSSAGMWLFLATEVMFFGGLFVAYIVYRFEFSETFRQMSRHLDVAMGTLNTAVLLTSSMMMAFAVKAARRGEARCPGKLIFFLAMTGLFGLAFLGIKAHEWMDDYRHGLFPGHWTYSGKYALTGKLFFYLYYAMVGLHGLHVAIGIGLISTFIVLSALKRYSRRHFMPIEVLGLYWHFVDLIWIFLYPLFYLIDPK